jgi:hypothetical protein
MGHRDGLNVATERTVLRHAGAGNRTPFTKCNVETSTDMFQVLVDGLVGTEFVNMFYFRVNRFTCVRRELCEVSGIHVCTNFKQFIVINTS